MPRCGWCLRWDGLAQAPPCSAAWRKSHRLVRNEMHLQQFAHHSAWMYAEPLFGFCTTWARASSAASGHMKGEP